MQLCMPPGRLCTINAPRGRLIVGLARGQATKITHRSSDSGAFEDYSDTLTLVRDYAATRQHPVELAILVCARLDSLANLASLGKTQSERFPRFLEEYSGQKACFRRLQCQTSTPTSPDITTPCPSPSTPLVGIQQFDRDNDLPFIRFIADSGLPLTDEAISVLLRWFSRVIQQRYRTTATQARTKPSLDTQDSISAHLAATAAGRRSSSYTGALPAVRSLIRNFSLGSILYRDFRSGIIHEFGLPNYRAEFFRRPSIYWTTIIHAYDNTRYLDVQLSASWLIDIFESCLTNYLKRLTSTHKLLPGLFFEICDLPDEVHLLDEDALPSPKYIGLALGR
jgi:hypothetical protein